MIIRDLVTELEKFSSPQLACTWDNVGLHIGDYDAEVKKILITVDVDDKAVETAISQNVDLIISHHPFFFRNVKKLNSDSFLGKRSMALMSANISVYCMHTNFDCSHMGGAAADRIGLTDTETLEITDTDYGFGSIGNLPHEMSVRELCELVKRKFGLEKVVLFGNADDRVTRVAVMPGSGKEEIELAFQKGAKAIVTGDVSYHFGIDGVAMGINVIDAGHYGVEHIFINVLKDYLESNLSGIEVVTMPVFNPQQYI